MLRAADSPLESLVTFSPLTEQLWQQLEQLATTAATTTAAAQWNDGSTNDDDGSSWDFEPVPQIFLCTTVPVHAEFTLSTISRR